LGRLLRDIRFGSRFLLKHPAFTALVVVTLGLGIGASTAIFSVVNRVLLEPLPYAEPERLVLIRHDIRNTDFSGAPVPPADVMDFREQVNVFEAIAATDRTFDRNLTGDGPAEVVRVAGVTANFFDVLGVRAERGRTFVESDGQRGASGLSADGSPIGGNVVISHGLWKRRFAEDEGVIGRILMLNDVPLQIVGVMPADFRLHMPVNAGMPTDIDVWNPTRFDYRLVPRNSQNANRRIIARLAPGVTLPEAQRQADAVAAWQRETYDYHRNADIHISVAPMHAAIVRHVRPILIGLFAAVGIVLIIACANVANLLLVQATSREREIAIRAAVGGGRRRILGQLMTESLLLATVGGLMGLLIARWGIDLLLAARPANLPRLESVPIDGRVLAFTLGITVGSAMLFGTFPALQASRPDLHRNLNDRGVRTGDRNKRSLRGALVVSEVALAMVLLIGAGLMVRSLRAVERIDLGFSPEEALSFNLTLPFARYGTIEERGKFIRRLELAAGKHPGILAAGVTSVLPLGGQFWTSPYRVERHEDGSQFGGEANYQMVTPGMFGALEMRLVAGRWLTDDDNDSEASVVVVDRSLAARAWPGRSPVGRKLYAEGFGTPSRWFKVVGVVESLHLDDPIEPSRETIFFPYESQGAVPSVSFVARSAAGDPKELAGPLHEIVKDLDPEIPLGAVRPLEAYVSDATAPVRFATMLIGIFALVALALAAVGVYGVVSSLVRQRTREIGLRLALGAPQPRIVRAVMARGLRLGVAGLVTGALASLALTRMTASVVTGVSPTDPLTYAVVGGILLAVTGIASALPARRAVRVDPMEALRYE
jgi:putative ABC transport system permease protein